MTDKWFENEKQNDNERKRFSFLPTHIWHIAFCPTHKPTLRKNQRAKSALLNIFNNQINK